jgi:CheY-like chemotaxis protein
MADKNSNLIVVDDESEFCDIVQKVAESMGFNVYAANNAREFQQLWLVNNPAVIVMDVIMPDMNGTQLLQWLANECCYDPIIMMTGYGEKVIEMAGNTGDVTGENIVGTLEKPFSLDALKNLLGEALKDLD